MNANHNQVGGEHYKSEYQHWDFVADVGMNYFEGQITKYVYRWRKKNGLQDLEKARHFAQKYRELITSRRIWPSHPKADNQHKVLDFLQSNGLMDAFSLEGRIIKAASVVMSLNALDAVIGWIDELIKTEKAVIKKGGDHAR